MSASPLALAAAAEPEGVLPGAVVTFTLALSNTGAVTVGGLAAYATLPDGSNGFPTSPAGPTTSPQDA